MRAVWLVPIMLAAVLAVAVLDRESGLPTWLRLREELLESNARIAALSRETQTLRREIEALGRDPFAIESAIREDLELARPGEIVIRFTPEEGEDGRLR